MEKAKYSEEYQRFKQPEYTKEISLQHNEIPATLNIETGEIKIVKKGRPKKSIPNGKQLWLPNAIFNKSFPQSWKWLESVTTPLEFKCAVLLGLKAKAFTNSLEPFDDETCLRDISEQLNISLGVVSYTMKKLFTLGVYGRFETYTPDKPYSKYWLFNPFLSFNGKLINSDIAALFQGTYCAMAYQGLKFEVIFPEFKKIKAK
jgi:hypothetical protein